MEFQYKLDYSNLSDRQIVEKILAKPHDEEAAAYLLHDRYALLLYKLYMRLAKEDIWFDDCVDELFLHFMIARQKNEIDSAGVIANWMRNRNIIEYLGSWDTLYDPNFTPPLKFEGGRRQAGPNAFTLSPTQWIETTNAIGLITKAGRRVAEVKTNKKMRTMNMKSSFSPPLGGSLVFL